MAKNTKDTNKTVANKQVLKKPAVSARVKKTAKVLSPPPPPPPSRRQKLSAWLYKPVVGRLFMASCGTILLCTVLFWTILSASLQSVNADQLIDSYLFENVSTFSGAVFPGAHSF